MAEKTVVKVEPGWNRTADGFTWQGAGLRRLVMNEAGPSRAYVTEGADKSTRAVNAVKKEVADVLYPKPDSRITTNLI
ncbi:uncharacterized protein [Anabrus simplex]|uniref:uncharacterized protein isoform X3 n=1 Tax=Anabrus simplex TaxID=316456 RepID=UPI0034DCD92E